MSVQSVVKYTSNILVLGATLTVTLSTQGMKSDMTLITSGVDDTIQPCQFSGPCPTTTEVQVEQSTIEQM